MSGNENMRLVELNSAEIEAVAAGGVLLSDGVVLGDGIMLADGVLVGDLYRNGVLIAD